MVLYRKKHPAIKTSEIHPLDFLWFNACWRAILSLLMEDERNIIKSVNTTFDVRNTFLKETTTHERTEN